MARYLLKKPQLRFRLVFPAHHPYHIIAAMFKAHPQQIIGPDPKKCEQAHFDGGDDIINAWLMKLGESGEEIDQQNHQKCPITRGNRHK